MKIDFTKIDIEINFEGLHDIVDIAKPFANYMKYKSTVYMDLGFDELARKIYFDGEVDIPYEYVTPLKQVILEAPIVAAIKRRLLELLTT